MTRRCFFPANPLPILYMTNFHDLVTGRRSIRRYTSDTVDADDVRLILEAALMSPTSKSSHSWRFICVDDPEMLRRLGDCKAAYATSIKEAPLAIVIAGDPEKSGPWIEDASVAASFIMLQAADLGLGSCWVQVHGRDTADGIPSDEYVRNILGIPGNIIPLCIISIGHPAEQRKPQNTEKLLWEKVHIGEWSQEQAD